MPTRSSRRSSSSEGLARSHSANLAASWLSGHGRWDRCGIFAIVLKLSLGQYKNADAGVGPDATGTADEEGWFKVIPDNASHTITM